MDNQLYDLYFWDGVNYQILDEDQNLTEEQVYKAIRESQENDIHNLIGFEGLETRELVLANETPVELVQVPAGEDISESDNVVTINTWELE